MEKILLVEPNYKNKYPPIGLMKIATYYKNKGDFVEFYKGLLSCEDVLKFDRVFVTTLFTFDFDVCINTIKYYKGIVGIEKLFVGGIAATIMPEKFRNEVLGLKVLTGQLLSSNQLGYRDNINIDILELDYDILWDIEYEYPAADSYFIYTTRGCPRKCPFCAVRILEPTFYECDNLVEQVKRVDEHYGIKRNLLIMDNNILNSDSFHSTIKELISMGFGKNNNTVKKCNQMKYYLNSLYNRQKSSRKISSLLGRITRELKGIKYQRVNKRDKEELHRIMAEIENKREAEICCILIREKSFLIDFYDRYNYHSITRHVDFNQGLDARLFDESKAEELGKLAIRPCRIAFDDIKLKDQYLTAMELAVKYDITNFSNYLLYNYIDTPDLLWQRLNINVEFCRKHEDAKITLFSFPMKYASIERTDRDYVGCGWHKKYLRAINVILNVTSGIVAKEQSFFFRAFGRNEKEFIEILTMPDDFIRYREFFDFNGYADGWRIFYESLSDKQKRVLLVILDQMIENPEVLDENYEPVINNILFFYKVKKNKVEKNELYYKNKLNDILNTLKDK